MVQYPAPTRLWHHCPICGIRLTREAIDTPAPAHEPWCRVMRWHHLVQGLYTDCEDGLCFIVRWRRWSERLLELSRTAMASSRRKACAEKESNKTTTVRQGTHACGLGVQKLPQIHDCLNKCQRPPKLPQISLREVSHVVLIPPSTL